MKQDQYQGYRAASASALYDTAPLPSTAGAGAIDVTLDGQSHALGRGASLAQLLDTAGYESDQIATAVNQQFVPRTERAAFVLCDGDEVVCFQAIVGG